MIAAWSHCDNRDNSQNTKTQLLKKVKAKHQQRTGRGFGDMGRATTKSDNVTLRKKPSSKTPIKHWKLRGTKLWTTSKFSVLWTTTMYEESKCPSPGPVGVLVDTGLLQWRIHHHLARAWSHEGPQSTERLKWLWIEIPDPVTYQYSIFMITTFTWAIYARYVKAGSPAVHSITGIQVKGQKKKEHQGWKYTKKYSLYWAWTILKLYSNQTFN